MNLICNRTETKEEKEERKRMVKKLERVNKKIKNVERHFASRNVLGEGKRHLRGELQKLQALRAQLINQLGFSNN